MAKTSIEQELSDIRHLMQRSSRFISLSGISGVFVGSYALLGALIAYWVVYYPFSPFGFRMSYINESRTIISLLLIAGAVLLSSLLTVWWMSKRKAQRQGEKIWSKLSQKLLIHMSIPMLAGGIFILIMVLRGNFALVASASLIFYGLALVMASTYTFSDILYLGLAEIVLGLIVAALPGYGLVFWALGFGVFHILYGIYMNKKYERESI